MFSRWKLCCPFPPTRCQSWIAPKMLFTSLCPRRKQAVPWLPESPRSSKGTSKALGILQPWELRRFPAVAVFAHSAASMEIPCGSLVPVTNSSPYSPRGSDLTQGAAGVGGGRRLGAQAPQAPPLHILQGHTRPSAPCNSHTPMGTRGLCLGSFTAGLGAPSLFPGIAGTHPGRLKEGSLCTLQLLGR